MIICVYSRDEKLKEGLLAAVSVPLKLASKVNTLWPTLSELATVANIACKSDLQVRYIQVCIVYIDIRIIIIIIKMLEQWRPVVPISFVGNVHVRLQGPILGGWRLWSHHQSGAAKSALDARVVFSSLMEGVSRYCEHMGTLEGISSRDIAI